VLIVDDEAPARARLRRLYVVVHTAQRAPFMRRILAGLVRVHRSVAVALAYVTSVQARDKGDSVIVLRGAVSLPCSRQYRADVLARLPLNPRFAPARPRFAPNGWCAARMRCSLSTQRSLGTVMNVSHRNPWLGLRARSAHSTLKILAIATGFFAVGALAGESPTAGAWPYFSGDPGGLRHSPLTLIERTNVHLLQQAWVFHTGDLGQGQAAARKLTFEATPILVQDMLVFSTAFGRTFGVDARSGALRWQFDAQIDQRVRYSEAANRGVAAWTDHRAAEGAVCKHRIFTGTIDGRLIALDARTGRLCVQFNGTGQIDIAAQSRPRKGEPGQYAITSPPLVVGDLVITGCAIGDNRAVDVELGLVRALDARAGRLVWAWNPIPQDAADPNHASWGADAAITGAANAWAPLSADPARDLVFVPTGSAAPDFFGGRRRGDNRYANSVVALRASTGRVVWSQQLVHHDLWDYDTPAQPLLIELQRGSNKIPAVVQTTKAGMLFVFHRETGEPLVAVEERPVPVSDVPEERASPTQPFSTLPALVPQHAIKPEHAWGLTFWDKGKCREQIEQYRSEGIFTPPSVRGSIEYPGYAGGSNWGGLSFDPTTQTVIANTNNLPFVVALIPGDQFEAQRKQEQFKDWEFARQAGTPYGMRRTLLKSPLGLPCIAPPWGQLTAIDLGSGRIKWQRPLGTTRDMALWPFWFAWGMPNMGGALTTASGLTFIAAASDNFLRAFDTQSGEELWKARLSAGGQASPMTYALDGKQYIAIAAGGHGALETTRGDALVAFAITR
jgi:quinoprotein glucose dehydrogenase